MPEINLWYVARATGMVSLLLITATVLLGILGPMRVGSTTWPRFALAGLHRNISLLTLALVAVHVLSIASDEYVPVRLIDGIVPFVSPFQQLYLGLGTLAFDLMLALMITSLLRPHINQRLWRAVHWAAYLCWPVAFIHSLGSGTDAASGWPLVVTVLCAVAVLAGIGWRISPRFRRAPGARSFVTKEGAVR
ncbi:ferric reductase-like transmembrane domain-containing protein [Actinomycetes bacterium KLBMP 9797]